MKPMVTTWKGKRLEELTREELIEAVNTVMEFRHDSANQAAESKIDELTLELKIKDELIEKLIKR